MWLKGFFVAASSALIEAELFWKWGAKIMDQFDSMHSYLNSADMEEATEGLKNIISTIADKFKARKMNNAPGLDRNLQLPAKSEDGTTTYSRSKSNIKSAPKVSGIDMDEAANRMNFVAKTCYENGVTKLYSFGVFGPKNVCAAFFKKGGDEWRDDKQGKIAMHIYRICEAINESGEIKPGTAYFVSFSEDYHVNISFAYETEWTNHPDKFMLSMMKKHIGYQGGSIDVQDHAAEGYMNQSDGPDEIALECTMGHAIDENFFEFATEAFTKKGKKLESVINAVGGKPQMIQIFLRYLKSQGVRFPDKVASINAFRIYANKVFAITATTAMMNGGFAWRPGSNTYTYGDITFATNDDIDVASEIWVAYLTKKNKVRMTIISAKRIAQMFNDEHTEINKDNADKVAKKIIELSKAE